MTELRDLTPHTSITQEQAGRDGRQRRLLRTFLPEMVGLERLLAEAPEVATTRVVERVVMKDLSLPIYQVDIGSARPDVPAVLIVGAYTGWSVLAARW